MNDPVDFARAPIARLTTVAHASAMHSVCSLQYEYCVEFLIFLFCCYCHFRLSQGCAVSFHPSGEILALGTLAGDVLVMALTVYHICMTHDTYYSRLFKSLR